MIYIYINKTMMRKDYLVEILTPDRDIQHTKICKGRSEVINYINSSFNGAKICTKDILQTKLHNSRGKKINKILRNSINIRPVNVV